MRINHLTPRASRGFSLIELMVAVTIGLIVTLAITGVLVASESRKRTANSVNDLGQTGNYLTFVMEKTLRSAGSGFSERSADVFGCALNASLGGTQIMPPVGAFPAPFAGFANGNRNLHMAQVVIGQGESAGGSDVLMVMTGNVGGAGIGLKLAPGTGDGNTLTLPNVLTINSGDMMLLTPVGGGGTGCLVTQVNAQPAVGAQQISLAGSAYFSAATNGASVLSFDGSGFAVPIGNPATQPPQFQLIGVGANNTLFSYDLLQVGGVNVPVPMAEGVVAMHARYGIDTDNNNVVDKWVRAVDADGLNYSAVTLMNGSEASRAALQTIVAVRVGFVLRTNIPEKDKVSGNELRLFDDPDPRAVGIVQPFTPVEADKVFRHRIVEVTMPLRNALL